MLFPNGLMSLSSVLLSPCLLAPQWCQAVLDGYLSDEAVQQLLTKLFVDAASVPNFSLRDGLLRFKGRVWIGNNSPLQQSIILALHASPVWGHSGVPVTYQHIKKIFAWPSMKKGIQEFVAACTMSIPRVTSTLACPYSSLANCEYGLHRRVYLLPVVTTAS